MERYEEARSHRALQLELNGSFYSKGMGEPVSQVLRCSGLSCSWLAERARCMKEK